MKKLSEIKEMDFDEFYEEVIETLISCLRCPLADECSPNQPCKELWRKALEGED